MNDSGIDLLTSMSNSATIDVSLSPFINFYFSYYTVHALRLALASYATDKSHWAPHLHTMVNDVILDVEI